jgi:hypothetical protein
VGLRGRALIALMTYTFGRVGGRNRGWMSKINTSMVGAGFKNGVRSEQARPRVRCLLFRHDL